MVSSSVSSTSATPDPRRRGCVSPTGPRARRPVVPVHVYDLRRRHDHPISDSGNAEWPGLARLARLWDSDPSQRLGPIGTGSKICGEAVKEGPHRLRTLGFDVGDTHAVDARGSLVGGHVNPRPPHHVAADEFVEEGMEPACPVLLGTAIQHALKGSNGVQTIGLADGPSRVLGTHQRCSSFLCTNEAGVLRSGRLCCPARHHYYGPLRLPLGCRPLPGVTGYRQAHSTRKVGAEEGLSSSLVTQLSAPRPLRRRVLRRPLQDPRRLPWPSPNPHRLGTLLPRRSGNP
jgi:hypothetical protein